MGLSTLLKFRRDDSSTDPRCWSRAKLVSEIARLENALAATTLSSDERAAIQQVLLGLYCESTKRRNLL